MDNRIGVFSSSYRGRWRNYLTSLRILLNALLSSSEKSWSKHRGLCKLYMPDLPPVFLSLNRGVPPSTLPPSGTRRASITPAAGAGTCTDVWKKRKSVKFSQTLFGEQVPKRRCQYMHVHVVIWHRQQPCLTLCAPVFHTLHQDFAPIVRSFGRCWQCNV